MSKKFYYQYQKELGLPIFICMDPLAFDQRFQEFVNEMKFTKLNDKEEIEAKKKIQTEKHARVLLISEATPPVSRQIQGTSESDRYGMESITPKDNYHVYRYKNNALMIYSFGAREWQLGCYANLASKDNLLAARTIINRYLSWALSPLGILGLWGVTIDDGIVAQRASDSKGEAVFIEMSKQRLLSVEGVKKIGPKFKILRLDPTLHNRNIRMTNEEFVSFLYSHCTYFDYVGPTVPVRQLIQSLAKNVMGLVHPQESFRPRTDLSL
jgi:hypothetical protein